MQEKKADLADQEIKNMDQITQEVAEWKRKESLAEIWTSYLALCKSKKRAYNVIRKITGKNRISSELTEYDIGSLHEDLERRSEERPFGISDMFVIEHGYY